MSRCVYYQVWFSNRRARLRKTAQSCSSPGYNPLALNMGPYTSPASAYMPGGAGAAMEGAESAGSGLYSSAMQGLTSYASNIMGHTMNQYAAQSSLLSSQVELVYITTAVYFRSNRIQRLNDNIDGLRLILLINF